MQKRHGAEQFRMRAHDQVSRNRGEIAAHPALGLEPGTEFGLREELRQPRHDAAGDVDAASRAQEVARAD